jgi:DNA gyrase subunit A
VKTINVTEKTGKLVGLLEVDEQQDLMITCKSGVTIRMKVIDISEQGRATQGVKLIRLDGGDEIAAITQLDVEEPEVSIADALPDGGEPITDLAPGQENDADDATDSTENPSTDDNTEQ